MITKIFLAIASIFGGLAVGAGAFASHALKDKLSERALEIFETAARYQMYHALALLLVTLLINQTQFPQSSLIIAGWAFIIGIVIFSGSLYALSLTDIKVLGAITPVGGLALIIGWGVLAYSSVNFK